MKVFWWTESSLLNPPQVWKVEVTSVSRNCIGGNPEQVWGDTSIMQLLLDDYHEISTKTAHALGLPI